jgi:predicted alpha/beta superfamily hydrolase
MLKYLPLLFAVLCIGCVPAGKPEQTSTTPQGDTLRLYSHNVKDSFLVLTALPNDYDDRKDYPVVYLLDGNYYFDLVKTGCRLYTQMGLMEPVILVAIGYPDPDRIDDNRTRDDTYPVAKAEYEMNRSGGADTFLSFIRDELQPLMDKRYATDTASRILAGHSLAGYFTIHVFSRSLEGMPTGFSAYIAASPSLHYNDQFLLKKLDGQKPTGRQASPKLFITFGGLEDEEDADEPDFISSRSMLESLSRSLDGSRVVRYKTEMFSGHSHMETPFPSFMKGIQWVTAVEQ